ncbi:MAG: DALR domain-containing protein, partial [Fusobacteriaceae bacterium]
HNGYINIKGEKMSKSLGNFFLLRDVLKEYSGNVLRFFILSSHYRKPIDFSEEELKQSKAGLERIENSIVRANEVLKYKVEEDGTKAEELSRVLKISKEKFVSGMDEDFNTAMGIGAIFEIVKELNKTIENIKFSQEGLYVIKNTVEFVTEALEEVLGVKLIVETKVEDLTKELIEFILKLRMDVREEKNWTLSDKIRDGLSELGIKIKDGKDKTQWSI